MTKNLFAANDANDANFFLKKFASFA